MDEFYYKLIVESKSHLRVITNSPTLSKGYMSKKRNVSTPSDGDLEMDLEQYSALPRLTWRKKKPLQFHQQHFF